MYLIKENGSCTYSFDKISTAEFCFEKIFFFLTFSFVFVHLMISVYNNDYNNNEGHGDTNCN